LNLFKTLLDASNKPADTSKQRFVTAIFLFQAFLAFAIPMRRVLVTGGAGFVGLPLVNRLIHCKVEKIVIIDNLSNGNNNYSLTPAPDNVLSFYKEDIRNQQAISDIIKNERVDTCIHLAAIVSVDDSIRNPHHTIDVNINGTFNVLEACSVAKVKNFVFSSSCAVYGKAVILPLSEDHIQEPISPYGATKVAGEALVSAYRRSKKIEKAISLRLFNVFGENQNALFGGVISQFASRLRKGLAPIIYGDGNQTRDFVYVGDAVQAIINAATLKMDKNKNALSSYSFNVGTGIPTTINSLAYKMKKLFRQDLKPIYRRPKIGDVVECFADTKKSRSNLNFITKFTLDRKLTDIIYK
jgi:UDP-glucose 4-epimerase